MTFVHRKDRASRASFLGLVVCAASLVAGTAALAGQINLPDSNAVDASLFTRRPVDLSVSPQARQPSADQSGTNLLSTKLDFTNGQIQLFRFRLDKVPYNSTLPNQQIDAGGIKLKWNW